MKNIITILAIFTSFGIFAQNNVGVGTLTPNANAKLEIKSDDKGVLITRLTTVARNTLGTNLTAVEDGMLVYDKNLTAFYYWDGPNLQWVVVGNGAGSDNQNIDNFSFDNTTNILTIEIEDGNIQTVDLTNLLNDGDSDATNEIELPTGGTNGQVLTTDGSGVYAWVSDDGGTDDQNIANLAFDNTTNILTVGIENGTAQTIDLSSLVNDGDSDATNEIELPTGGTNGQVLTTDGSGVYTWVSDNGGTDDQNIANLAFDNTTNILTVGIENGTAQTIDLTDLVNDGDSDATNEIELPTGGTNGQVLTTDGSGVYAWVSDNGGTDNQNIANLAFDNTTNILTVGIENGTAQTIDLTDLVNDADNSITNEIQDLSINTTTNILTITNNGSATNIDLSSYLDNTDNQDLSLTGNTLSLTNDGTTVDLSGYMDNTDAQNIAGSSFTTVTGNLVIGISNGTNQTINLNGLKDHDWYEVGTTRGADNISDNIFTQGKVGIGVPLPTSTFHVASPNLFAAKIQSTTKPYTDASLQSLLTFSDINDDIYGYLGDGSSGKEIDLVSYFNYDIHLGTFASNTSASKTGSIFIKGSNGNVGIGTTTPASKTHIFNTTGDTELIIEADPSNTDENDNPGIILIQDNNLIKGSMKMLDGNNLGFLGTSIVNRTTGNALVFNTFASGIPNNNNGKIDFATLDTVRMSINAKGGNVGINTTTPTEKLEVNGSVKITDGTQGAGKVLTSDANGKASWQAPKVVLEESNGSYKRMCSGKASSTWVKYVSHSGVYIDVNTSGCMLTNIPRYITSIQGGGNKWNLTGTGSVYNATATGFRIYVRYDNDATNITAAYANSNWQINWIAIGD